VCCAQVYLKREDLNHTGAHKINNAMGQVCCCVPSRCVRVFARPGCHANRSFAAPHLCGCAPDLSTL